MLEFLFLSWNVAHRNWLVYKKDFFSNISPSIIDPMLFIIAFGFGLGHYISEVNDVKYLRFIAPGLVMSSALFTSFFESSYNFYVRLTYEGIFKALMTTPIGAKELIAGEYIWLAIKGAVMAFVVSVVLTCFGGLDVRFLLWAPILGVFVSIPCGALGLLATAFVRNINQFQAIYALLISPMFFFSGIFYPLTNLPEIAQRILLISPLAHAVTLAQLVSWERHTPEDLMIHGGALIVFSLALVALSVKFITPKLYK
jgi:lipooligosaccharide transport system permease protein